MMIDEATSLAVKHLEYLVTLEDAARQAKAGPLLSVDVAAICGVLAELARVTAENAKLIEVARDIHVIERTDGRFTAGRMVGGLWEWRVFETPSEAVRFAAGLDEPKA